MPNTFKSNLIAAKDSRDISSKSLSGRDTGAQVLYATAEYTFKPDGATPQEVTGDVIELADIPAGAVIVPQLSYLWRNFSNANIAVSLGDAADADRFGQVNTSSDFGPGFLLHDVACHAYFGYGASEFPAPLAAPLRVVARFDTLGPLSGSNNKLSFGIAYRVQG